MIKKSYLFLGTSIMVYLLLLYIIPYLPHSLSDNLFFGTFFLHIPSLILSILGIYYGVKGVKKYKASAKGIVAIILNTVVIVCLALSAIVTIFIAFLFFFGVPL